MTFETFDQSYEETWPDPKRPSYLHTYLQTYLPTYLCTSIREHPKGVILETLDPCDICSEWWEDMTWPKKTYLPTYLPAYLPRSNPRDFGPLWHLIRVMRRLDLTPNDLPTIVNCVRQWALTIAAHDNPGDLWHLRQWLQFWHLRTCIHDNFCYLTIKSDSGQHLQFLQCFSEDVPKWGPFSSSHLWFSEYWGKIS